MSGSLKTQHVDVGTVDYQYFHLQYLFISRTERQLYYSMKMLICQHLDYRSNFQKQKTKKFASLLERLAGSRGGAPSRDSAESRNPLAQAKRRRGRSINFGLTPEINANSPVDCFSVGKPLVRGFPMDVQSASMTAQSNS